MSIIILAFRGAVISLWLEARCALVLSSVNQQRLTNELIADRYTVFDYIELLLVWSLQTSCYGLFALLVQRSDADAYADGSGGRYVIVRRTETTYGSRLPGRSRRHVQTL